MTHQPQWFVTDANRDTNYYKSEAEAEAAFHKSIETCKEDMADEWPDDIKFIEWGQVFQTTNLKRVKNTENDEYELEIVELRSRPSPAAPDALDIEALKKYLFERAEEFQKRNQWDSSFECLYLVTVINRGYSYNRHGRVELREQSQQKQEGRE